MRRIIGATASGVFEPRSGEGVLKIGISPESVGETIEKLDASAVDSISLLTEWNLTAHWSVKPRVAEALAKRGDLSVLSQIRATVRDPIRTIPNDAVWFLVKYGDADDLRFMHAAALSEIASGANLGSTRIWGAVYVGVTSYPRPLVVPILVDLLKQRKTVGQRVGNDCMRTLEKLVENYDGNGLADIDRWLAWWDREGREGFLRQHPEVADAMLGSVQEQLRVLIAANRPKRLSLTCLPPCSGSAIRAAADFPRFFNRVRCRTDGRAGARSKINSPHQNLMLMLDGFLVAWQAATPADIAELPLVVELEDPQDMSPITYRVSRNKIATLQQADMLQVLRDDGQTRLRLTTAEATAKAIAPEANESPLPSMVVKIRGEAFPDSLGRMWSRWDVAGSIPAVFDGDHWQTFPEATGKTDLREPGGYFSAIPGVLGAMIFTDDRARFHLIDGRGWVMTDSAEALATQFPARLRAALDWPPRPSRGQSYHLIKDAKGRIWWAWWPQAGMPWGVVVGGQPIRADAASLKDGPQKVVHWRCCLPLVTARRCWRIASRDGGSCSSIRLRRRVPLSAMTRAARSRVSKFLDCVDRSRKGQREPCGP
ncbi:MAG: hypothetical protein ACKV2Q_28465 [Planctomycetaceae bacterium]